MIARRGILSVPASEPGKVGKAAESRADEIVVDLEDAVALDLKDQARLNLTAIAPRARGAIAVRVNAVDTRWFAADVTAAWSNPAITSIVVPKIDSPQQLHHLDALFDDLESRTPRRQRLGVQALIESAEGVVNAVSIAKSSSSLESLILGYADLAASLGRRQSASWQYAQDALIFAARAAKIQAIDGPVLTVHDDDHLHSATTEARGLGFDGKWVIHPRQLETVLREFTASAEEIEDARGVLAAMDAAAREGRGAVEWKGRMLDEALAVQARRTIAQSEES